MNTAIHRIVDACRAGNYSALIARVASGWAVLGQSQFLRGYSLLLPDPVVPHLNALAAKDRSLFLSDMAELGDAVLAVTGALRINYAMFGNLEPALHAHVVPRYVDEPEDKRTAHPWVYDWGAGRPYDATSDAALLNALRERLRKSER